MIRTDDCILTLDVDWAPDWVIDRVAQILIQRHVRATWFVTHASEAIERLRDHPELFELGIHPNCHPGSTHGTSEDAVLAHCRSIVPEATSMRTHDLRQSTTFLVKASREHGIRHDLSLFLPLASHLTAHRYPFGDVEMVRIPYNWEDDAEMFSARPLWDLNDRRWPETGLLVLDFHPIHIVLNTARFATYSDLKSVRPLPEWDEDLIADHANPGLGPGVLFEELTEAMAGGGRRVRDLAEDLGG